MFSLKLLGGASIEGPQGTLGGRVSQRRRLALLGVLALARHRPVSRDRLLALFWPESDTERARHSLADLVYQLRRELGEAAILSAGDDVRLDSAVVASDVAEFEAALERGDAAAAVGLYHGPFLDGFFLSDAPEFERWVDLERERLARGYAGALERLAEEAARRGETQGAVTWWRRLAAGDPYNARITLRLMEALEAAGDRAGALQQARIHAALLEDEFAAEPDPEVEALAERLRSGSAATPPRGREARNGDEVPVLTPVPQEDEVGAAPAEEVAAPERSAAPRTHAARAHLRLGGRITARLLGVLFALVGVTALIWRISETSPPRDAATETAEAAEAAANPKAIVVLPCANLSSDPEEEYFSDGLTEELTGMLAQVRALQVVARTSAFAFKGENRDVREIGRALGVGTLLECSVRRAGERVRVTAQLINAGNGFHLWADTFEQEGTDVFAIQSALALRIAGALEAELTPAERARLARRPTAKPEAHALYLKGLHFWNQRTASGFARALEYYQRAIEVDPGYAAAYAGLAITYSLQGLSGELAPQEARERMGTAVATALELDAESAEAHTVLGAFLSNYAWDSEGAERAYLRALELDPNHGTARHLYANLLGVSGRLDEAMTQRRKAVELDPLAPQLSNALGGALIAAGHPEEGLEHLRNALELHSTHASAHATLGYYYETTGRIEEAIRSHQRAVELAGTNTNFRASLAGALARAGRKDEARRMLGELQAEADRSGIYSPAVASVLLALDDIEGTLTWLERSYQQKHPRLRFLGRWQDPRLANDPRYVDLLRRIGLPH